ncbi:hypothetical protein VQ03_11130 [Methylobacterium tarhaniae]|uniref:Glycosyl transferase family 1 n=1 Tax=Methylobacterium tarhaniae TaxID=1187852 RepID=A0A0J6T8P8_9HYPH|nr:glycosyltransferase [Methylobacterium tarhaniae]KMO42289.1 hypothetical protein VQ03_11130 [Methylobacterium tarhaniae]
MRIVQLCGFGRDGDALYRIHEPAQALASLPGVTMVDAHLAGRHGFTLARRADLLVLHFADDAGLADLVRHRRAEGRPTVFEANDDFFDLQPWNPIAGTWAEPAVPALYRHLLRTADGVQASTPRLAERWRDLGAREVAVFDNHLAEAPPPLSPPRSGPLTIGWAGSPGHFADLYWIAPALQRWLDAHPETRLAIMTGEPARAFFDLPPERYRFVPFGSRADYLGFLDGLDIGLAPLLPSGYNRGRSDVKHLEYASRGVAGLYADLDPYQGRVVPGETGLLFGDPAGLCAGLDRLAGDAALRERIRAQAYRRMCETRRLPDRVGERLAWYETLVRRAGPPRGARLNAAPGYHAIDLAPDEAALAGGPLSEEDRAGLDRLLAAEPGHRMAARARARSGLARREIAPALEILRRALACDPSDTALGAELGRALFLDGDVAASRRCLETVIAAEPAVITAWQYRLRVAAVTGEPDGAGLAARAVASLPENAVIALLAAALLPEGRMAALEQAVDRFGPVLHGPEREGFAASLVQVVTESRQESEAERCALLGRACAAFPESAALARLHGRSLRRTGAEREGWAEEARAASLPQGHSEALGGTALTDRLALHILAHAPL